MAKTSKTSSRGAGRKMEVSKEVEKKIIIDYKAIFFMLLKKIWVFLLIGLITVAGFIAKNTQWSTSEKFQVTTKLLFIYEEESVTHATLDNASRMQPTYDAIEILSSGDFLEQIVERVDFETNVSALRDAILVKWVPGTRVVYVYVDYEYPQWAMTVAEEINDIVNDYFKDIYGNMGVHILESPQLPDAPMEAAALRGGQQGVIVGLGVCIMIAMLFIVLYLFNDSIRTEQELKEVLDLPLWGTYQDELEEICWNIEKAVKARKTILITSSINGEGKHDLVKGLKDTLVQAKKTVKCMKLEEYEEQVITEEYAIVEAPTLSQSLAGLRFADEADITILLVGANRAGYQTICKSKELLTQTKCKHIATVFYKDKGAEKILKYKK